MSAPPRTREREEERRLSIRTLAIAAIASATAAVVTSQFWTGGTPIAAAVTPVIVALVSEMLHRPTEAIARRVTAERTVILERAVEPEPRRAETPREGTGEAPVRVYGRERRPRLTGRRKIAVGVVATTAVLGFAIAAAALTLPELITGHSLVKSDRNTTLIPTKKKKSDQTETTPTTPSQQGQPSTQEQQTEEQSTTPTPTETETTPTETETTPKGSK